MPGGTTHFLWGWHLMNAKPRRWVARASFALMFAAVALLLAVAGWRSVTLVVLTAVGVCAVLAGGYWFLANRGGCGGSRWSWWSRHPCSSWSRSRYTACCGSLSWPWR
jgi:hypothetical protein